LRHIVGIAEMKIASKPGDQLVTYALGSCLGLAVYDPSAVVGGILHAMLPNAKVSPEKAKSNPYMFIDTGTPAFFQELYKMGAKKENLTVKVCGGASIGQTTDDCFQIGKRNIIVLRKLLWINGVMIAGQDIGGTIARTLYLDIASGRTWIQSREGEKNL
jgi:chemotaxis protein CheD